MSSLWALLAHGLSDNFAPCDIPCAARIAAAGSIACRLEKSATGDAGPDFNSNGRQVCKTSRVIFELDILDHRRRQALDFVRLEFPLNFLRHEQEPLYTED